MPNRDIIVIGASMGGVEALSTLVGSLPSDLPAAVFVVQHSAARSPGLISEILGRAGALPACRAESGMTPENGTIYVAPPDRHMLLTTDGVLITFGPRENRSRPAIDPLFRTAAVNFGSRVVGVILTGLLGDGAAGLSAVYDCGGVAVVQDPEDADYPEMPLIALSVVPQAQQIRLRELGTFLGAIAGQAAPPSPPVNETIALEARLTEQARPAQDWNVMGGAPTRFTCPECMGALQRISDKQGGRYRCRVGHSYTPEDLFEEKKRAVENALWLALQTLEERAEMLDRMAVHEPRQRSAGRPGPYVERSKEARGHASQLRDLLANLNV